jgi:hypothetical protein
VKYLLFFLSQLTFGQTLITGKVSADPPLSRAFVTVSLQKQGPTLAYTTTDAQGHYRLSFTSHQDSIYLKVQHMGYKTIEMQLKNVEQHADFTLVREEKLLDEVVVKPPVLKRNDTLSYSVEAFQKWGDRALADVLKRIPGLEVDLSGKITYQGNPIEKFYIEGLDLMGANYNMVNTQLPPEQVDRVEVLENHQSIRMLEGKSFTDKASINLRLKRNYAAVTPVTTTLGGPTLQGAILAQPMVFSAKNQFLGNLQANTTGAVRPIHAVPTPLNDVPAISKPGFPDSRWGTNASLYGAINYLRKAGAGQQLRLNLSGDRDQTSQTSERRTQYFLPGDERINFSERNRTKNTAKNIRLDLQQLSNDQDNYFKQNVEIQISPHTHEAQTVQNGKAFDQRVRVPYYSAQHTFSGIKPVKRHLVRWETLVHFQRMPQHLQTPEINQRATKQNLHAVAGASLYYLLKPFTWNTGLKLEAQSNYFRTFLSDTLGNDMHYRIGELKWENTFERKRGAWLMKVDVPMALAYLQASDRPARLTLPYSPQVSLRYAYRNFWKYHISVRYAQHYGDIHRLHSHAYFSTYRNRVLSDYPLPEMQTRSANAGLNYSNPFLKLTLYAQIGTSHTRNSLLMEREVLPDGTLYIRGKEQSNSSSSQTLQGGGTYAFSELKVNYTLHYTHRAGEQLLNAQREKMISGTWHQRVSVDYFPLQALNLQASLQHTRYTSPYGRTDNVVAQASSQFRFSEKQILRIGAETYRAVFLDASYRYLLPKVDIEVSLQNLLNKSTFVYRTVDALESTEMLYTLRPARALLSARWRF